MRFSDAERKMRHGAIAWITPGPFTYWFADGKFYCSANKETPYIFDVSDRLSTWQILFEADGSVPDDDEIAGGYDGGR